MTDVLAELKAEIESIAEGRGLPPRAIKILQWLAEQAITQDGVLDEARLHDQLVRLGESIEALMAAEEGEA